MGGWMDYQRMRARNNLLPRTPLDASPYPDPQLTVGRHLITGDLNRMERDYLTPTYPRLPFATRPEGSDPASECAAATGVDVDTVRLVLSHVFGVSP